MILPAGVESEECFGEPPGGVLFPRRSRSSRTPWRRGAVTTPPSGAAPGPACERLGYPPVPILPGVGGAPTWPAGVRGSMTHCTGYAAAAVGPAARISTIGIDAEPDAPLPDGVLGLIATPVEQNRLGVMRPEPVDGRASTSSARMVTQQDLTTRTGTGCCSAPKNRCTKPGSRWSVNGSTPGAEILFHPHNRTFTALLSRDGPDPQRPPHPPTPRTLDPQTRDPRHRRSRYLNVKQSREPRWVMRQLDLRSRSC